MEAKQNRCASVRFTLVQDRDADGFHLDSEKLPQFGKCKRRRTAVRLGIEPNANVAGLLQTFEILGYGLPGDKLKLKLRRIDRLQIRTGVEQRCEGQDKPASIRTFRWNRRFSVPPTQGEERQLDQHCLFSACLGKHGVYCR